MVFLSALPAGCSEKPDDVMDEELYGNVLIELTIINHMDESQLGERTPEQLRDRVFEKYSVTREQFRISHEYYQLDMQKQMQRVEEYSERLRAERDSIQQAERQFRLDLETARVRDSLGRAADTTAGS